MDCRQRLSNFRKLQDLTLETDPSKDEFYELIPEEYKDNGSSDNGLDSGTDRNGTGMACERNNNCQTRREDN